MVETFFYPIQIPFVVSVFKAFPFVVQFFTTGQGYQHFGKALFIDKKLEWDDGQTRVFHLFVEFVQFSFVEQKFATSPRLVVKAGAIGLFLNVHVYDKKLPFFIELTKTFGNGGFAVANRLDFGSGQYNSCGELIE